MIEFFYSVKLLKIKCILCIFVCIYCFLVFLSTKHQRFGCVSSETGIRVWLQSTGRRWTWPICKFKYQRCHLAIPVKTFNSNLVEYGAFVLLSTLFGFLKDFVFSNSFINMRKNCISSGVIIPQLTWCVKVLGAQLYPTLCDPMDWL